MSSHKTNTFYYENHNQLQDIHSYQEVLWKILTHCARAIVKHLVELRRKAELYIAPRCIPSDVNACCNNLRNHEFY